MVGWWMVLALAGPMTTAPDAPPAPATQPVSSVDSTQDAPAPAPQEWLARVDIACEGSQVAAGAHFDLGPNTLLELELVDPVSSASNHPGDTFSLRLREPLMYGPTRLLPAGTFATGQVVHAARSRGGGKAGELILAARWLQTPQGRIRLRASIGASGTQRTGASLATAVAFGPIGLAVHGAERELAVGTPLVARLADPISFRCGAAPAPLHDPAVPAATPATQGLPSQ
jgi:hypothetical protein